jgi:hypothetical protein
VSVIYTILPLETVVEGMEKVKPYLEIEVQGVKMQVEQQDSSIYKIVRLLSSDPFDYLKEELQPGALLQFTPQLIQKT